jgi:hypothetical protein
LRGSTRPAGESSTPAAARGSNGGVRGAKSKSLGDAWCWSRKASSGDVALVVAMTLALAVGSEIPIDQGEIVIY